MKILEFKTKEEAMDCKEEFQIYFNKFKNPNILNVTHSKPGNLIFEIIHNAKSAKLSTDKFMYDICHLSISRINYCRCTYFYNFFIKL